MKKSTALFCISLLFYTISNAQILRKQISLSTIASEIPAYLQVSSITPMSVSYTPATPATYPTPMDEDTSTEGNGMYDYASILPANITAANGNTTNTTIGKVWTLRISIPNALNIGLMFTSFNLSASAELYIFTMMPKPF